MTRHQRLKLSVFCLAIFAVAVLCVAGDRGQPAAYGIPNFGKVNDRLYRGSEPNRTAIKNLQKLGIKTIIDLRSGHEVSASEATRAAAAGITYTNVPLNGITRPTDEQVDHLLALIDSSPAPVFIHCEYGCDRTGTIIACYRIRHDHWALTDAQLEADAYGMSKLEHGMRNYLATFAVNAAKNK